MKQGMGRPDKGRSFAIRVRMLPIGSGTGLLVRVLGRLFKLRRLDVRALGGILDETSELGNTIDVRSPRRIGTRDGERTKNWSRERKHEQGADAQNHHEGKRNPHFPTPPGTPRTPAIAVVVEQSCHL